MRRDGVDYMRCLDCDAVLESEDLEQLPTYDDEATLWGDSSPEATVDRLQAFGIGEIVVKNGSAQVKAVTDMQTFGMIATAEPYFAVTQPGNVVVLEALPVASAAPTLRPKICSG